MSLPANNPNQDSAATDARLESLELKLMDMEIAVQQLNDVIIKQFQDIERLQLAHAVLLERLDTSSGSDTPSAENEIPPHY